MGHDIIPEAEALLDQEIRVLDKGFVRLVDYMGGDRRIVQAARVSYGEGTRAVREDAALIDYLIAHQHTSPLEHVVLEFHCKMPIFVARQWIRHRTARMNEISGRYSVMVDEFYVPPVDQIRRQASDNKQGRSSEDVPPELQRKVQELLKREQAEVYADYEAMLKDDIARELARINLPLSLYTQWYWQMDLHNLFHFLALRMDPHAQWEIREYATAVGRIARAVAPMAYASFERHILRGYRLSEDEVRAVRMMIAGEPNPLEGRRRAEFEARVLGGVPVPGREAAPPARKSGGGRPRPDGARTPPPVSTETVHGWRVSMSHDEIMSLPLRSYEGPVRVVRDDAEVGPMVKRLKAAKILGFDTESRPSFKPGQSFPVSIIQLATTDEAYVIQLKALRNLEPIFQIFSDPRVVKAGVALDQDVRKLRDLRAFEPAGFVDIAREVGRIGLRKSGLRSLAAIMLGFRISKSSQRSNWAMDPLTPSQIVYAATDAWVSRELYVALDKKSLIGEPPPRKA
jgi:thymidylate synthase (FAD)